MQNFEFKNPRVSGKRNILWFYHKFCDSEEVCVYMLRQKVLHAWVKHLVQQTLLALDSPLKSLALLFWAPESCVKFCDKING